MIGGNIFAIAFGQNLDAHAPPQSPSNMSLPLSSSPPANVASASLLGASMSAAAALASPLMSMPAVPMRPSSPTGPMLPSMPTLPTLPAAVPLLHTRGGLPSDRTCFEGRACYVDTLKITLVSCCVALILAVFAAWRDYRRMKASLHEHSNAHFRRRAPHEVTQEDESEILWDSREQD